MSISNRLFCRTIFYRRPGRLGRRQPPLWSRCLLQDRQHPVPDPTLPLGHRRPLHVCLHHARQPRAA